MYVRYFTEKEEEKAEGVKMTILTSVINVSCNFHLIYFFNLKFITYIFHGSVLKTPYCLCNLK